MIEKTKDGKKTTKLVPIDKYARMYLPLSLNEVCYIMQKIIDGYEPEEIARIVQRTPEFICFKFFEERPVNEDGTLDSMSSKEKFLRVDWEEEEDVVAGG